MHLRSPHNVPPQPLLYAGVLRSPPTAPPPPSPPLYAGVLRSPHNVLHYPVLEIASRSR